MTIIAYILHKTHDAQNFWLENVSKGFIQFSQYRATISGLHDRAGSFYEVTTHMKMKIRKGS